MDNSLALAYDASIDWKARLDREIPLLLAQLPETGHRRVLDVACGTGRHLLRLAELGCTGLGIDHSHVMINRAHNLTAHLKSKITFRVGDMRELPLLTDGKVFDLVICLGNSLALLPEFNAVKDVIADMFNLLREQGRLVLQVLNFEEIRKTNFRFFPLKEGILDDKRKIIFVRFFEHDSEGIRSYLILTSIIHDGEKWQASFSKQSVLNLNKRFIDSAVRSAGFRVVKYYSDFLGQSFDPSKSRNLVAVAPK